MKISSFSATEENSSKSCNLYEYFVTKGWRKEKTMDKKCIQICERKKINGRVVTELAR